MNTGEHKPDDWQAQAEELFKQGQGLQQFGRLEDALSKYEVALQLCQTAGDRIIEGVILNHIGLIYYTLRQYERALSSCQHSLAIHRDMGDREGEGTTSHQIGLIYSALGQYEQALSSYQQVLAIRQEIGDRQGEGAILKQMGGIYYALGQYEQVLDYYQQALAIYQEIGDLEGEGRTLNQIGEVYYALGQYESALDYYQQALAIQNSLGQYEQMFSSYQQALALFRKLGNRQGEGLILKNIGAVYSHLEQYESALDYCQQALAIHREIGDRQGEGGRLNQIGNVYYALKQYESALDYCQQALAIHREIGDRQGEGGRLNQIGNVYYALKQYKSALDYYQQALAIYQEIGDLEGEGKTLRNIGEIHFNLEEEDELALEYYRQALAIFQKLGNRQWEGALLGDIGKVYFSLGQDEPALASYQQGLAIVQEIGDRQWEGTLLCDIGKVYFRWKQYSKCNRTRVTSWNLRWSRCKQEQALNYYQQSLAIFQGIGDRQGEGTLLFYLGEVYSRVGPYEQALNYYQQALATFQGIGDRETEEMILYEMGQLYFSERQYEQALSISRKISDRDLEGASLHCIGNVYSIQGQYERALEFYQQALTICREFDINNGSFNEPRKKAVNLIANSLINIGNVYSRLGQYEQALESLQQALTNSWERQFREGEKESLNSIGNIYSSLGQYEQALDYHQKALAIRDTHHQEGEGTTLMGIGAVYYHQRQYEQALKFYKQALAIRQTIGDRKGEGESLNCIGEVYLRQQYPGALDSLYRALTISRNIGYRLLEGTSLGNIGIVCSNLEQYEQALNHCQQALAIFRDICYREGEGNALGNIGHIYARQGDTAQAITFYQQAIEIKESIQDDIKIEELKASFAGEQINVYEELITLLWKEDRVHEALNYMERARAQAFLNQIANGPLDFRIGADTKLLQQEETLKAQITALRNQQAILLKQERSLQRQIRALRTQMVTLRSHPSNELDTEEIANVQKQLSAREKEYTQLLTQLKLQSPEVATLVSVDVAPVTEIQSLLDVDTTLVEYFVSQKFTLAFILTHNSFKTVTLNVSREDLTKKIEAFRRFASLKNSRPKSLQQLHEWLITPLKPYLSSSQLSIVPHGVLHYLPFSALTDGHRYLSDDYTLVNLPSASVLRFLKKKRKFNTGRVLVLGNPTTTEPLPALHYAEQEAKRIAQMYSTPPLVGAAATESAVFSQAEMAGILHLAAHGKYNPDNPLFSTLYLAPDKQRDGRLEVHDIYGLDLTKVTNLVVLSACQTQMGQLSKGDEVVGLNRAFLYAGTPSVMASLWSVDDKVTGLLMEGFYTHLQAGMTKAEALRQAQIDIRTEYPHPYYWAAFVLTGDGGSVAVSGGLAGVKQRLASSSDKVRIAALSEALEYVTEGSLLVAQIVKTETGAVQCAAYDLLYRETDEEGKQELLKYFPLRSEVGADYTKLRDLLAAKKWKEADQETRRLMLWVAHGEQKGRLTSIDIEQFPCADLLTIDHLWVRESGNRFGFSVQKRIYFEKRRNYDENLGWIIRAGKSRLVRYSSGIFNLDAPVGHLPYQCSWSSESSVGGNLVPSLAQKLETCSIP